MDIEKIKERLISDPEVKDMVARRAFEVFLARDREKSPGTPASDWLRAESEILPKLVEQIVEQNRQALGHDESDPTVRKAAEHMEEERHTDRTSGPSEELRATAAMTEQNLESTETKTADDDLVPDASALADTLGKPVGTPKAKASRTPKATSTSAAKTTKRAPSKTEPASKTSAKAATKKAAPKTADSKASSKPATSGKASTKKASAKSPSDPSLKSAHKASPEKPAE